MAVKKDVEEAVLSEEEVKIDATPIAEEECPILIEPEPTKAPTVKAAKSDPVEFCVYLGPTIHGVIQSGMVFSGNRKNAEKAVSNAIAKYPLIKRLIVTNKTLVEDRVKVKTAGNVLNVLYRKLASGKTI